MNNKENPKLSPKLLIILTTIVLALAILLIVSMVLTQHTNKSDSTSAQIEVTTEATTSTTETETTTTTTVTTTTTTTTTSTMTTTSTTVTTTTEVVTEAEPAQAEIPALSDATLQQIAAELGVPSDLTVTITQGEPWWWDGAEMWIRDITVIDSYGTVIAAAGVDAYTGDSMRSIYLYEEQDVDFSPNVWCPYCGYGFFTTGVGNEGLFCPSCGQNFMPPID